ncbi:hypothetical protein [Neptuniibacter sp. QD37_11]|uniref:hypothetical protein n=1 Tax=Neptuniibacter sp. QD37_11 TaxID=3398209 RepID=UPI0039F583AB
MTYKILLKSSVQALFITQNDKESVRFEWVLTDDLRKALKSTGYQPFHSWLTGW